MNKEKLFAALEHVNRALQDLPVPFRVHQANAQAIAILSDYLNSQFPATAEPPTKKEK